PTRRYTDLVELFFKNNNKTQSKPGRLQGSDHKLITYVKNDLPKIAITSPMAVFVMSSDLHVGAPVHHSCSECSIERRLWRRQIGGRPSHAWRQRFSKRDHDRHCLGH